MLFNAEAKYTNAVANADPVANPADVLDQHLLRFPVRPMSSGDPIAPAYVVLEAPAAETLTVDVFIMDDRIQQRLNNADNPTPILAERRFYLVRSALVLTGGTLVALLANALPAPLGTVYVRRTADALTATRRLLGCGV